MAFYIYFKNVVATIYRSAWRIDTDDVTDDPEGVSGKGRLRLCLLKTDTGLYPEIHCNSIKLTILIFTNSD